MHCKVNSNYSHKGIIKNKSVLGNIPGIYFRPLSIFTKSATLFEFTQHFFLLKKVLGNLLLFPPITKNLSVLARILRYFIANMEIFRILHKNQIFYQKKFY